MEEPLAPESDIVPEPMMNENAVLNEKEPAKPLIVL